MDQMEMQRQMATQNVVLSRLVQIGTVTDIDAAKRKARVKFQNLNMTSGWLTVVQHYGAALSIVPDARHTHAITDTYTGGGGASTYPAHNHAGSTVTYWMPKVNDTVLVLYLPVENSDGYILGGV